MRSVLTAVLAVTLVVAGFAMVSCDSGSTTSGCTEGAMMVCSTADGSGTQTCVNGVWDTCVVEETCDDGASEQCTTTCGTGGVKTCAGGDWGLCASMAVEQCNGADDDCDQLIDEGLESVACNCGAAVGIKTCAGGTFSLCTAGDPSTAELCNNQDDNCNGQVDENVTRPCTTDCGDGVETCYYGEWGDCDAAVGTDEICDGEDNDCNGETDDGLGDIACGLGECAHTAPACTGGVVGTCDPMEGSVAEECDQLDNDCDGETDEGTTGCCTPLEMAECSTNEGECDKGVWECDDNGTWGDCSGTLPVDEICDGKDNDCNGETDDGNPQGGAVCGSDVGECQEGIETCVDGGIVCQGEMTADDEVCDGKDNDCNGATDDGLSEDEYETNEACNNGYELSDLKEEAEEPAAFAGTLYKIDASADEDWYKIHFSEQTDILPPCSWNPLDLEDMCYILDFELMQAVDGQEFCVKLGDCSDPEFEACGGAEDFLVIGWPGTLGFNDDQDLYIQVKGEQSCAEYAVEVTPYSVCPNEGLCPWEDGYVEP